MLLSFANCDKVGKIYPAHSYREAVCVFVFGFVRLCCSVSPSVLSPLLALLVCVSSVCLALVPLSSLVACGLSVCSCWPCLALRPSRSLVLALFALFSFVLPSVFGSLGLSAFGSRGPLFVVLSVCGPLCRVSLSGSSCFTCSLLHISWN